MRNTLINEINNLFDEINDLTIKCERLKDKNDNNLARKLVEFGRDYLCTKLIDDYGNEVTVSKENDNINVTNFDEWLIKKINEYSIPSNISKEEAIEVLKSSDKAFCRYNREKEAAMKNFEERDSKNE